MANESAGASLTGAFKKANHWRHRLMDLSMLGMAIGAVVATGGVSAFFDPLVAWAKMHVSGIEPLLASGPEFLSSAFEQASNGTWYTGMEVDMGSHAGHLASAAPTVVPASPAVPAPVEIPANATAGPADHSMMDHSMHHGVE